MTRPRKNHRLFNFWIKVRGLIAFLIIMAGVLVAIVSLLLPFESLYKSQLEDFLGKQWQLDLSIAEVDGEWQGYGPRFRLKNLLLKGEQSVQIDSLDLKINVFQAFFPGGKSGIELGIEKADLALLDSKKGADFSINQTPKQLDLNKTVENFLTVGALRINELSINLHNEQGKVLLSELKASLLVEKDSLQQGLQLNLNQKGGELTIKAIVDNTQSLADDAVWYVSLSNFDLAELNPFLSEIQFPSLQLDGEMWLEMNAGELVKATALFDWEIAHAELSGSLTLKHQGGQKNWQSLMKLADIRWQDKALESVDLKLERDLNNINFSSPEIDLKLLNAVSALTLKNAQPLNLQGHLRKLYLSYHYQQQSWQEIVAEFTQLSIDSPELSLANLNGEVSLYQQQLNLSIESKGGTLRLPQVFRGSAQWRQLLAQLQIPINQPRQMTVQQLWVDGEHYTIDGQLQWFAGLKKQADYLSMQARTWRVDVTQLNNFWPHLVWDQRIIDWLDNGLRAGQVNQGYLFHQGQMVEDAYEKGMANFFARAYVQQTTVNFHADWPPVKQLEAEAEFNENSFLVKVNQANSQQLVFNQAQVGMQSYKQDYVALRLSAKSRANTLLEYLRKSPIMQQVELNHSISLAGKQTIKLNIDIPLEDDLQMRPQGSLKLHDSGLNSPHLQLEKLNGTVKIDGYDLLVKNISGQLFDTAIKINGKIESESSQGLALQLDIDGDFSAQKLFSDLPSPIPVSGSSAWNFHLQGEQDKLKLSMSSDLNGTTIDLPEPMKKQPQEIKPLNISCEIPCEESIISLDYQQILHAIWKEGEQSKLHRLWFGKSSSKQQVQDDKLGGQIADLDIDGWLELLKPNHAEAKQKSLSELWLPTTKFLITIDRLKFMGRYFKQLELGFEKTESGYQISINSPAIKGTISIAKDLNNRGIVADFEHFHWKEATIAQTQQLSEKIESLPDLHIFIKKFSYNQIDLGSLRLEMRNVAHGLHVEQLSLKSQVGSIQAVGDWYKAKKDDKNQSGQSAFDIIITAESITEFLKPMGFNPPLSDAQTLVKIKALWDGMPSRFDLKQITGTLDIKIGEGEVLDAEPGFGRVLGLFSLTNLPRRLLFDFRDVMGEGLHFSNMEGHFVLDKGIASTDNFQVKASSANIKLTGKTNFILQNYDQTIMIQPQIGKTFPTIGAIAGGAVGAAAGFLVQGLLDKQLKLKNQIIYRVTGSWQEPIIEVIEND